MCGDRESAETSQDDFQSPVTGAAGYPPSCSLPRLSAGARGAGHGAATRNCGSRASPSVYSRSGQLVQYPSE
jgi:hypothetical protein